MNFQIGQVFNKNGKVFCLLDLIVFENKNYALFSVEDSKISYVFYEINDIGNGYNLIAVVDDNLNNKLLNNFEERNKNEEG